MSTSKPGSKTMQQPLSPSAEREWEATQKESENISGVAQKAAHEVSEAARKGAQSAQEMAAHGASAVGKSADDMTGSAGAGIKGYGDQLRSQSSDHGVMGHASQAAGEFLHDTGEYIENAKLSGMAEDITDVIKQHPVPSVLVGIGLGVLLGRSMRS